jgi:mxaJ protein
VRRLLWVAVTLAAGTVAGPAAYSSAPRPVLRVCADPNNLPFSNQRGEGFENKIAERLAKSLGAELRYTFWAQRRGFVRSTLQTGACDVIMGVVSGQPNLAHTAPYYRSSYVFVTPAGRPAIRSFDDPALRLLRIGIPLIGDDGANPPPEAALARRGIVDNVAGFGVYGDYARPDPPLDVLRALSRGEIDVAAVWGPLAGYFATRNHVRLTITPMTPGQDAGVPLVFDISLGVRRGPDDEPLRQQLDRALQDQHEYIRRILDEYGVPRV